MRASGHQLTRSRTPASRSVGSTPDTYARAGGITRRRVPPTRAPGFPCSQPGITSPAPSVNRKVRPTSPELSNSVPSVKRPTCRTVSVSPSAAAGPDPTTRSVTISPGNTGRATCELWQAVTATSVHPRIHLMRRGFSMPTRQGYRARNGESTPRAGEAEGRAARARAATPASRGAFISRSHARAELARIPVALARCSADVMPTGRAASRSLTVVTTTLTASSRHPRGGNAVTPRDGRSDARGDSRS